MKTLPKPVMPASVWTATRVWTESSGRISCDQPPLGLSPSSGAATMEVILMSVGVIGAIRQKVAETPPSTIRIWPVT